MTQDKNKLGLEAPKFDPSTLVTNSFQHVAGADAAGPPPFATPPEAAADPAAENKLPLPVGAPVMIDPAMLTPLERAELTKIGWQEGTPVPSTLPQQLDVIRQEQLQQEQIRSTAEATDVTNMPPPANPSDVPPLTMPPRQQLDELSPAHRQAISEALTEAQAQQRQQHAEATMFPGGAGVGVREAAMGVTHKRVEVADDREQDEYETTGEPKRELPPAGASASSTAGKTNALERCPHCDWDLQRRDSVEVTDEHKRNFLQAQLGGIPWQHVYSTLGGQLSITVRQLLAVEVDKVYTQVHAEHRRGTIQSPTDFWEQISRYRMCLQIVDVRSEQNLSEFPESYDAWGGELMVGDPTTLPQISAQVYNRVIHTESLHRILATTVATFNRLTARLEANVNRPDFWEPTGSPT